MLKSILINLASILYFDSMIIIFNHIHVNLGYQYDHITTIYIL